MKILYLQPGPGIGGSKISLYNILRSAPDEQISHVALTMPSAPNYEQKLKNYVTKIHYLNLPTWNKYQRKSIVGKARAPFSHVKRLLSLQPAIYKLAHMIKEENIDLAHTNNGMCAAGAFASNITNRPHVWYIREPIGTTGQYPLILGDKFSAQLFRWLRDVIVCNSEYTAKFFQQLGYSVKVIGNGLDLQSFQRKDHQGNQLRSQLLGDITHPVIAMIGNLTTGLRASRYARTNFSNEVMMDSIVEIYKELL